MNIIQSLMLYGAAALASVLAAVSIGAQGPPPQPAGSGVTMSRTWSDDDLDKLMKEIGATVGVMRKGIDAQNPEAVKTNADKLEELFEQVDDFWDARNVRDAQGWADDAAEHAEHVEDAADGKDFTKAAEHAKLLQGMCATCHTKYRDKDPNGGYRIKP